MQINQSGGGGRAPLFLRLVTPQLTATPRAKLAVAPKTTFILSTGRTGTVYLADLLNQLDGVVALHEPKPSRVLNAWTTAFLEGKATTDFLAAALAGKRRKTLGETKADLYVESNNFIAGFADAVEQVFEKPTIVHIVRDPRDFITSQTNRGDDAGLRRLINKYVPYWAYVPKGVKRRQLNALNRAAYRWTAVNQYLNDYGRAHPKNYHFFRFEDVFDRQHPEKLKPVLRALGVSAKQIAQLDFAAKPRREKPRFVVFDRPTDSANTSKHNVMKNWREWTKKDKRTVEKICGELMRQYGYGGEPAWRKAVK